MKKKFLSLVLVLSMLCAFAPVIHAAEIVDSGECGADGDNLTWTLDDSGILTISGEGEMEDFNYLDYSSDAPWYNNRSNISNIVIENGVTSIGAYAFYNCTKDEMRIEMPTSIIKIGSSALSVSYPVPHPVFDIYYSGSEEEWKNLNKDDYSIPESCVTIYTTDSVIFPHGTCGSDGNNLTWIFANNILTISGTGNMKDYWADSRQVPWVNLKKKIENVVLGSDVTSIGGHAFCDCPLLTEIDISDNVTYIGYYVFDNCVNLKKITIGTSVEDIKSNSFNNCSSLENITVKEGNIFYSDISGVLYDKDKTSVIQCPCKNQEEVYTIPDSVTTISASAFYGCENLKSVIIPNSVTSIGDSAFCECINLDSINISDNITYIGYNVFYNTAYYNDENNWEDSVLYVGKCLIDAKDYEKYKENSLAGDYTIKNGTTTIASYAFSMCYELTSITIPNSVKFIGMDAFNWCKGLKTITLPASITSISNYTFWECENLLSIYIPDSVTSIGSFAFGDSALTDIYYSGSQDKWSAIRIDGNNSEIYNATIHPNAIGTASPTIASAVCSTAATAPQINVSLTDTEYDSTMITAFYKDSVLVDMQTTLVSANDTEKNVPVTDTDANTAKVMIWSSVDSMKPLCEAETVDLTEVQ